MTPKQIETKLRAMAMKYPEVHEDFPWGERAIKVKVAPKKIGATLDKHV